jgi:type VI secretion system protein ImpK
MTAKSMSLTEACAPVFLYLTTFRRNATTSRAGIKEVKDALQREVENVQANCETSVRLRPLADRILYPLVATADQVLLTSSWNQRAGWSMTLLETHYFKTAEGGRKFFRVVEEVLGDPTEAGRELAEVLFVCMGLGFQGELMGERKEFERRRQLLFEKARLPGAMGAELAPECYAKNVVRPARRLPMAGILRLALVALAALIFAFAVVATATGLRTDFKDEITEQLKQLPTPPK